MSYVQNGFSGPESPRNSALVMDVNEVVTRNLAIVGSYIHNPDRWQLGVELVPVPPHYDNLSERYYDLHADITRKAQVQLHSFMNGSNRVIAEQAFGACAYWSFMHNDQIFYVTETELYSARQAAALKTPPITASIDRQLPPHMKKLLTAPSVRDSPQTANHEVFVKGDATTRPLQENNQGSNRFAGIGRRLLRWIDRRDPTA